MFILLNGCAFLCKHVSITGPIRSEAGPAARPFAASDGIRLYYSVEGWAVQGAEKKKEVIHRKAVLVYYGN